jgi:hypothetical protein
MEGIEIKIDFTEEPSNKLMRFSIEDVKIKSIGIAHTFQHKFHFLTALYFFIQ